MFNLQRHSSSEALSLSLYYSLRISPERTVFNLPVGLYFFLFSPSSCTLSFTLSDSLVLFYNISFSSVVPSLEHRHSLYSETRLVRATPDQKLASIPCAARTGLESQHLTKTIGGLSSKLWKIGLERLAPDQKKSVVPIWVLMKALAGLCKETRRRPYKAEQG